MPPPTAEALAERLQLLYDLKRFRDLERAAIAAVGEFPREVFGHRMLAWARYNLDADAAALDDCHAALALDPADADLHILCGYILLALKRHKPAVESATEARRLEPDSARALTLAAHVHLARGKLGAARRAILAALKLAPDSADLWRLSGLVELGAGKPRRALPALGKSLELDPALAATHSDLATYYETVAERC